MFAKRMLDVVCSGLGLILLSPLLALVCVWIKLDDGGPIFFRQERIGRNGRSFRILKFRTMGSQPMPNGPLLTIGADERITPAGSWLRKLKFDELPQLWNVLKGEMSLVGPRPEVAKYVELYDSQQRRVLDYVPGITDPASIRYSNESEILALSAEPESDYISRIMPDKIRINLEYQRQATLWSDLKIIFSTFTKIAVNDVTESRERS